MIVMSVWSLLLRVLLTVGLILNGSGNAVASAHMQMPHMSIAGAAPLAAANPVATAEPSCHEPGHGAVSVAETQRPDAATDAMPVTSEHPSPDCCKSEACSCACVHQAQAAVPAVALQQAVIEHVSSVRPMKSGHDSPALPHLIRPPIG